LASGGENLEGFSIVSYVIIRLSFIAAVRSTFRHPNVIQRIPAYPSVFQRIPAYPSVSQRIPAYLNVFFYIRKYRPSGVSEHFFKSGMKQT